MYSYTKTQKRPLLSNYTALDTTLDFWKEYRENYFKYDKYFKMFYKTMCFFDQEEEEELNDVTNNFIDEVKHYLMANDKRLTELWRINVVPDDDSYSITENYYLQESYTGSATNDTTNTIGERTDTDTASSNSTLGSRTDTSSGTSANTVGQRTDVNNVEVGNQYTENVNKVTAFNSNTENTKDSTKSEIGTRNDITQFTQGQQTTTEQDARTNTTGSQTNSDSTSATRVSGSQTIGTDNDITETHTMTRHGAIGTMTVTDVLEKQRQFWSNCESFYEFVFKEIATRLLIWG